MASTKDGVPKYMGLSGTPLAYAVSIILTFGFVLVGYDQGVMSGVISAPQWLGTLPQVDGNSTLLGFTVAIYDIGCLLGALLSMVLGDRLGRRKLCEIGGLLVIVGVIVQVTTFNKGDGSIGSSQSKGAFAQFLIGRITTGAGNGVNMATMPVLQAEISRSSRGSLVCLETGLIATGTMLAYWLNYGVRNYATSFTWRFPIAFQCLLCLVYMVGVLFVPESPRWLCKNERVDEAARVMASVNDEPVQSPRTQSDIRAILDAIALENQVGSQFRLRDLTSGVIYYVPILVQTSLGKSADYSLLLGGINMVVYAVFSLISFWTVERVGRRKLFLIGSAGQCIAMVITFACIIPDKPAASNGALFGLFLYIAFFGATYLTVPWLYATEINPLRTRAKGAASANIVNWSMNFLIVMVTPIMVSNIGWGTYLFFGAVNFIAIPFIYFFYPETSHRTLEEIDLIFAKGYTEKISYVRAAKELPKLSVEDMERIALEYGLISADDLKHSAPGTSFLAEKNATEHVESDSTNNV
ncbi:hypothetical protein SEUCBS139899_005393 [Sporothrix eucalyptigena]|uniref:Major facilitator superfamily (MFS) profile domain-containing protein n=1 Tax=Sporothrix eucalyptigena TaxID=1812306 RepID=A0ABP0CXY1_9PEZI